MDKEADVLIIGGGAIGVCSAYFARKQGLNVTLLDKGEMCSGSSYGNAGLIVPSHCVPLAAPAALRGAFNRLFTRDGAIYVKPRFDRDLFRWLWQFRRACTETRLRRAMPLVRELGLASAKLFKELAARESLSFGFETCGYLRLCKTESGLKEAAEELELVKSIGVKGQLLNGDEVQQLEPNVRVDVVGGVSYPEDAHLRPAHFVRGLAAMLEQDGVRVCPSTEVFDFETVGRKITHAKTTRGNFAAKQIAYGPETQPA